MAQPNEIEIIREYDAPVKAVWEAWTDPAQAAKWWGPRGFTITTHSKELKPGGIWHYTMHGPDGTDYPNKALYHEIEKHKKLVYDHGGNDERAPMFRVTVEFAEKAGKTHMHMIMALPTPEEAAKTREFIKQAGGNATWDRLAEYLGRDKEIFVINRSFDAPIDLMFEMWVDPKHLSQWLAPAGASMDILRDEIRPGGTTFIRINTPMGPMYCDIHFLKIEKPNLLVSTQQFCDEHENIGRHPMAPTWPEVMLRTVTLHEEGKNRTRVTVVWEPYGENTPKEIETFTEGRPHMTAGWNGSFDKLDAEIAKAPQKQRKSS